MVICHSDDVRSISKDETNRSNSMGKGCASVKGQSLISALLGDCMCEPFQFREWQRGMSLSTQVVEFQGIRFIGLGAVADELTPRERVYDTLQQSTTRTERLVSVGYLVDSVSAALSPENIAKSKGKLFGKATEMVPLDVWDKSFPDDKSMSKQIKSTIELLRKKDYGALTQLLTNDLASQRKNNLAKTNPFLSGITAHNLAVVKVLAGRDEESEALFREAIALKQASFGHHHPEVALSLGELGIQLFARSDFEGALKAFKDAHSSHDPMNHPSLSMLLNNIGCCLFQMDEKETALETLEEARQIQLKAVGSSAQADLDLLHVAIVICNCGYLNLALKHYDEARSLLEEALLIQQSVLGDNHRAIRDTLSNIEVTNAFHS